MTSETNHPTDSGPPAEPPIEALYSPDQIYESDDAMLYSRITEDHRFDRKSAKVQPRELAKYLSGFGNGPDINGGVLAIGVEKDGTYTGCGHLEQDRLAALEGMGADHCPDGRYETRRVKVENASGKPDFLIVARIRYVEGKLVELTNGEAYERVGDQCKRLADAKKQEMRIDKGERSFELEQCGLAWPDDFDQDAISKFVAAVKENTGSDLEYTNEDMLKAYHLGKDGSDGFACNNACALLFAKDPVAIFPGSLVHFLRYDGIEALSGKQYNVIKDMMVSGTVVTVIREAAKIIDSLIREPAVFRDGSFVAVPEYPRDAWYETLVNACVHRSYNIRNAPVFVRMFDDRIEVESPGGFMPQITPETIVGLHRPRNPFVMRSLREFGEVRCISEGTRRMVAEMSAANLPPPEFKQTRADNVSVICILRNNSKSASKSVTRGASVESDIGRNADLTPEERLVVDHVAEHGRINVREAEKLLKAKRWHTAKKLLSGLVKRGVLVHVANGKTRDPHAYYQLAVKSE